MSRSKLKEILNEVLPKVSMTNGNLSFQLLFFISFGLKVVHRI
jgi:hypothetical protein